MFAMTSSVRQLHDVEEPARGQLLRGVRVLEFASFVAGPSGCMTLAQLGADIIRVDPLGGAADFARWPVSHVNGKSLYWSSLNKGKRSIAVDLRSGEGRELVTALATAPGPRSGIVVDNVVGRPWFSYEELCRRRPDIIQAHIQGHADGRPAVDYTINAEVGIPQITGPDSAATPVNHVLPAWDLLTGMTTTTALLAALLRRDATGEGAYLEVALGDVALAGVASMGWFAEAEQQGDRPRHGNHVYGSFGVDFATSDDHRVMVVALTARQWDALRRVTRTEQVFAALEEALDIDLSDEVSRYTLRETIAAILRPWFAARTVVEVTKELDEAHVLWSRYRSMSEVVKEHRQAPQHASVLADVHQPNIGTMLGARSPVRVASQYGGITAAPTLGGDTEAVLVEILGMSQHDVGRLHDRGVVGSE